MATPSISVSPKPGVYNIKSKLRGTNITLKGGDGTALTAWLIPLLTQSSNTDQQWQIAALGNGEYTITSNTKGFSVSAVKGSQQPATAQFRPPIDSNIRWTFEALEKPDSGNFYIRNVHDRTLFLDLQTSSPGDNIPIYAYTKNIPTTDNQIWNLVPV